MSTIKLLFGIEFWDYLEKSIQEANKYVFIFSAYAKQEDINYLVGKIKNDVPRLILVRDDIKKINQDNLIYTNSKKFHAKIYIIDNIIIIGSQNIYKVVQIPLADKTGELSVVFKTNDSVNIIYQSLMIVLRDEYENYFQQKINTYYNSNYDYYDDLDKNSIWLNLFHEYNLDSFLNIQTGKCPSCGAKINYKENEHNIIFCQEYNESMSVAECGHGNACKYCVTGGELIEPQILYKCTNCRFSMGYTIEELQKRPYWSWETLSIFNSPGELENFLKLYFYLVHQTGEQNTNRLLASLNILGNLSNLDLNKRHYEIEGLF